MMSLAIVVGACGPTDSAGPSASVPSAPTTSSASTEPFPTASPLPTTPDITWSEQTYDGTVAAVIADRDRFVIVSAGPESRVARTSADGLTWDDHVVPDPAPSNCTEFYDPICFPNSAGMGLLVRLGDTLYSIGTTESFNDYLRPVGWRWTDGQPWQAIQSQSEFYAFGQVSNLTASDTALVATKFGAARFGSNVWRWTPATSWVAADLAGSVETPKEIFDVTWGADRYVAIGATPQPTDDVASDFWPTSAAMWTSDDGLAWSSVAPPAGAATLCLVTSTTKGFIVLGSTETGAAIWASEDADAWSRADLALPTRVEPYPNGSRGSCSVAELDIGLLATRGVPEGTATWTSIDGRSWESGPVLDISTGPDQVAALRDTVVVFGRRPGEPAPDGAGRVFLLGTVQP
jgi:hypothetical protein